MSEKIILNLREEVVKISKYECNFLVDENDKIYVRWDDLKAFGIYKNGFEHWLIHKDKNMDYTVKYDIESYFTKENGKAVRIIDGMAICVYSDATNKSKLFFMLYTALMRVLETEKYENNKKEGV